MSEKKLERFMVAGVGMMGKGIAFTLTALPGSRVYVYSHHDVDVERVIYEHVKSLVENGILTEAGVRERIGRISFLSSLDAPEVASVQMVIESIPEKMDLKQRFFAELEARCPADAILCSNSSVMSPSEISRRLTHRERFAGLHFWNPAFLVPLVEVIQSDATAQETADTVMQLMRDAGKRPVLCKKDVPGFIGNRLQHAMWREAISMVEHGIASPEDIDDAIRYSFGLRLPQIGPMESIDKVGVDLVLQTQEYLFPHLEDAHEASPFLRKLQEEGRLGFKTGEGIRKWSKEEADELTEKLNRYLIKMIYQRD